jgi:hypothetical protein
MTAPVTMPAAFLGHGSPMNALERNRYTEAWEKVPDSFSYRDENEPGIFGTILRYRCRFTNKDRQGQGSQ